MIRHPHALRMGLRLFAIVIAGCGMNRGMAASAARVGPRRRRSVLRVDRRRESRYRKIGADYFAPTHARMLVFALGGKAVLPAPEPYTPPPLNPPPSTASAAVIARGGEVYTQYCSVCHGVNGFQARSSFPNLTITPLLWTQPGFDQVVLGGGRADKGMGSFAGDLKPADTAAAN